MSTENQAVAWSNPDLGLKEVGWFCLSFCFPVFEGHFWKEQFVWQPDVGILPVQNPTEVQGRVGEFSSVLVRMDGAMQIFVIQIKSFQKNYLKVL